MSDEVKRIPISDITPDTMNANDHTERGEYMLDNSYGKFGNRGAIVLDKNLKIPAGNHRHEKAGQNGIEEVVVIKGDPNKLYAIQYDDFDLDDPNNPAREFAVADNRTAEVGINLEPDVLKAYHDMGVELGDWFYESELDNILGNLPDENEWGDSIGSLPDGEKAPFQQMTFTLHDTQAETVREALSVARGMGAFDTQNENGNGNALARVCELFMGEHGQG